MRILVSFAAACAICASVCRADENNFPEGIRSTVSEHCFGCHSDGAEEGGLSFDKLTAGEYGDDSLKKWVAIWKNIRAETMPPADASTVPLDSRQQLVKWIESDVFKLDPVNIDPGLVTIRRLNREEYRHSISDLLGVQFKVEDEFPADDTGYGFDTIGDVLNMSPVLVEKYLQAAKQIAAKAIPLDGPSPNEFGFWSDHWKGSGEPRSLSFDKSHVLRVTKKTPKQGPYRLRVDYELENGHTRLTETTIVVLRLVPTQGERVELVRQEAGWMTRHESFLQTELELPEGEFTLELELTPASRHDKPADPGVPEDTRYRIALRETKVIGPLNGELKYSHPASVTIFDGPPPTERDKRDAYVREIIRRRADLAFRQPIDEPTLDRLTQFAIAEMDRPGQRFEHGIRAALALVLASPRFLFRAEGQPHPDDPAEVVELDEFDLASRMAFFLWSAIPDATLQQKARNGRLRAELDETIDKMLSEHWRSDRFVRNFVGQWLQIRDIYSVDSNESFVLGRDHPLRDELSRSRYQVRDAMRRETEELFKHLIAESRPVEELLTARYTFVNQFTAKAYGIEGVEGLHHYNLKKVDLSADSHRRGILTHGSILLVTSNPTRTSPVKRGLFILENLLGTPAPPPPPNVPALEEVKSIDIRKEPLRRVLEVHRESPECASCHNRMDPLGLALEHFDALGLYRDVERARPAWRNFEAVPERPIDVSGQLLTGEQFQSLDELIEILVSTRKRDLYRCLTEKMMTYALGRGIEYTDAPTIDVIVDRVDADGGSMRTLVKEIIKSRPFQYRRGAGQPVATR